ncbi:MAG: peroxiredoxin family protein [Flavobacteriales bacterium]
MKKISLILLICFSTILFAEFNIKGIISDYANKEITIRKAEGVSFNNATVTTNKKGAFNYRVSEDFTGLILLNIDEIKQTIVLLADGKDISFQTTIEEINSPLFPPNTINHTFQSYMKEANKENLNQVLDYILSLYSTQDTYYNATLIEKERLAKESFDQKLLDKYPLIQFYIEGQQDITKFNSIKNDLISKAERKNIIKKVTNSGEYLETTNLLGDYVTSYFMLGNNIYKTKADLDQSMKKDLDELLDAADIKTERGQLALTRIMDLLKAYNFDNLLKEYIHDVEGLTCEVSSVLTNKVKAFEAIKVGHVFPDSELPNGKSIHKIKAKNKVILFWSPECPHCLKDLTQIVTIYPKLKAKGGEIISFGADTDKSKYNELVKGKKWLNFYDKGSVYLKKYGIASFPTLILLDENNIVQATYSKIQDVINHIE